MSMETLKDLFVHELKDIYDAENKLVNAVESMASKVTDPKLASALQDHLKETKQQVGRLEQVFPLVGLRPSREACKGINGLIEEFSTFVKDENPSSEILDTFAIGAAQKVEHYEICGYESLIELATSLGLNEAVSLFEVSLNEEQAASETLKSLSSSIQSSAEPGQITLPQEQSA